MCGPFYMQSAGKAFAFAGNIARVSFTVWSLLGSPRDLLNCKNSFLYFDKPRRELNTDWEALSIWDKLQLLCVHWLLEVFFQNVMARSFKSSANYLRSSRNLNHGPNFKSLQIFCSIMTKIILRTPKSLRAIHTRCQKLKLINITINN